MIKKGEFTFQTEVEYFEFVMERYFRKIPPIPTNVYLNLPNALDDESRIKVAQLCHFPSVINTLARDENYEVREAALKNDFWLLVGELQDVLGFGKRERREFARREVFRILLVLLMFEDDLDIIAEVLRNASVSTQMLTIYIHYLDKRGRGQKDQQFLNEAKRALTEKRHRIIKAAEIQKARKTPEEPQAQHVLLQKLADEDKVIRQAVSNFLLDIEPRMLLQFAKEAIKEPPRDKLLGQFIILTEILRLIDKRDDIKHTPVSYLGPVKGNPDKAEKISIAAYFIKILNDQRLNLIEKCRDDLTDFQHVLLLANCHIDTDDRIREIAATTISLEDILALINDNSTPQHIFKAVLDVLLEHPDENVHKQVESTYHAESERMWNKLKELEQTINAYFDIIFQSLGFTQINEYNISIKTLEQAEKTIDNLKPRFDNKIRKQIDSTAPAFSEIKRAIEMQIYDINSDTSPATLKELYHILDMIQQVQDLKNIGKEGLRPGVFKDIDPDLLTKARTIWQSALGQFLGRIKHLNEMIKIKFSILARNFEKHGTLQTDFLEVVENFETNHKKKVNCHLKIACSQCPKRGCASERFMTETQFFIEELLDNFIDENTATD